MARAIKKCLMGLTSLHSLISRCLQWKVWPISGSDPSESCRSPRRRSEIHRPLHCRGQGGTFFSWNKAISGVSSWMSPAGSLAQGACGLVECGGHRSAGFDGHVPLLSKPGLGSPAPARLARVPGHICRGAAAYAACPVGRTRPRSSRRSSADDICPDGPGGYVSRVIVELMLKPEIHDPQGEAVASACCRRGFGQVLGIR